jgi:O-antigen ligase
MDVNPYADRFFSLIKPEALSNKSAERIEIYCRAFNMIMDRPLTGHGSGSFYLNSSKFSIVGDHRRLLPNIHIDHFRYLKAQPNFAHNFILQFAAELGIPATLLFCGLIGAAWYKGLRITRADLKTKNGNRIALALFLALTTYLITQMTANSLNIYVSHQFLFWFLIAALLTLPESKAANRPNAIG